MAEQDSNNEQVVDSAEQSMKQASNAFKEATERATHYNEAVTVRLIDFAESNLADACEALRTAARARNVSELMSINANFLRHQVSRSLDQFRELTELVRPRDGRP